MGKQTVNHAIPSITEPEDTVKEKVSTARFHIVALSNSPDYPKAPDVQLAADAWGTETDELEASNKLIDELRAKLAAAQANQLTILRRWAARRRGMIAAITAFCDGSKDMVLAFGFGVLNRGQHVTATVPENLHGRRSQIVGMATAVWDPQPGGRFMVQHAIDPASPATYSAPITCSRATFKLEGQTPGTNVYFRVLALDSTLPTGQTDYTPWVAVMVSS